MISDETSIILSKRSRLNFGKPTPVEHNLRVKSVGRIHPEHIPRLLRYFDEVNNTKYSRTQRRQIVGGGSEESQTSSRYLKPAYLDPEGQAYVEPSHRDRRRHDGGDARPRDWSNTTNSLTHQTGSRPESMRMGSAYGGAGPDVTGPFLEQGYDNRGDSHQLENEGDYRGSRAGGPRDSHVNRIYDDEEECLTNAAHPHHHQNYTGSTSREHHRRRSIHNSNAEPHHSRRTRG